MTIEMNVDVALLRAQKLALLRAIDRAQPDDAEMLDGVLALLDHVHDEVDPPRRAS